MKKQTRLKIAIEFMKELENGRKCRNVCPNHTYNNNRNRPEEDQMFYMRDNFCHYLFPELKNNVFGGSMCGPCPCIAPHLETIDFQYSKEEVLEKVQLLIENGGLRQK